MFCLKDGRVRYNEKQMRFLSVVLKLIVPLFVVIAFPDFGQALEPVLSELRNVSTSAARFLCPVSDVVMTRQKAKQGRQLALGSPVKCNACISSEARYSRDHRACKIMHIVI
ncbi:hypothetical protein BWQ96_09701 [Gracilariopsis chorda]|uniref:Uncharacterized protein n=1 Tax=Gracilariopsis chorda TaxID=448386 RepID=A0A2V3IEV1_9FLOR|nr:hypothetical protein BWQ96_09701 [Gracilariopsis chorda]|eukprot:PXF40597.1 hypothetical protein BWQ96_09701 [Gracilariopsis chorda]